MIDLTHGSTCKRYWIVRKNKWPLVWITAIIMFLCGGKRVAAWSGTCRRQLLFARQNGLSRTRVCPIVRLHAKVCKEDIALNPKLWEGATHSSSDFVTHVLAGPDEPTVVKAIESAVNVSTNVDCNAIIPKENTNLSASHLLQLGAVWFLPKDAPRNPSLGAKPMRLTLENSITTLQEGDYLRIHHAPRRFPQVHDYEWNQPIAETTKENKTGVIVAEDVDRGYLVINKPAGVPVHATVDNCLENVAECIRTHTNHDYVSTPQRLDQNTSGLLVVATKKSFAAYYAKLLRTKTDQQLNTSSTPTRSAIHKRYKCLVCLIPRKDNQNSDSEPWSVTLAMNRLKSFVGTVMRHYLEPSIRAPKHFARVPGNESWAESLLRIVNVGTPYPLVGSQAGNELANGLWHRHEAMPVDCVGVVELEVELLTGRTHQIRGQLSTEGFPLVGDAQYGGAIESSSEGLGISPQTHYVHSNQLALQCSQLEFLDPDMVMNEKDGAEVGMISSRWNSYSLNEAWWSPLLERYRDEAANGPATSSSADQEQARALQDSTQQTERQGMRLDSEIGMPPRVQLSPGTNKYVLVKAKKRVHDESTTHWFVKSASPSECGGAYHSNVAQDLVDELWESFDSVAVMGGGRIDYNDKEKVAHVYGFSYGFGKGDHALAARVIEEATDNTITVTFDDADGLY